MELFDYCWKKDATSIKVLSLVQDIFAYFKCNKGVLSFFLLSSVNNKQIFELNTKTVRTYYRCVLKGRNKFK